MKDVLYVLKLLYGDSDEALCDNIWLVTTLSLSDVKICTVDDETENRTHLQLKIRILTLLIPEECGTCLKKCLRSTVGSY